ncbi:hypothetical protein AC1031_000589 [Aphanomyces cochlioides]|nr:hypothetical protein AC1031_000589 [Aphanomyces cochlioides]
MAELPLNTDPSSSISSTDRDEHITSALIKFNQEWLADYAATHGHALKYADHFIAQRSLWLNDYFQKLRVLTDPSSRQGKELVHTFEETLQTYQLRRHKRATDGSPQCDRMVEPLSLIMYCATQNRCSEFRVETFLREVEWYLGSTSLLGRAVKAGFAAPLYRLLVRHSKIQARILSLGILLKLADMNAAAVVEGCQKGAQGQPMVPHNFIQTLPKRHPDNTTICDLAAKLLVIFNTRSNSLSLNISYAPPASEPPLTATTHGKPPKKSPVVLSSLSSPSFKLPIELSELFETSPYKSSPFLLQTRESSNFRPSPVKHKSPTAADTPPKAVKRPTTPRKPTLQLAPLDQIEQRLQDFHLDAPVCKRPAKESSKPCQIAIPLIHHSNPAKQLQISSENRPSSRHLSRDLTCVSGFQWWWRTVPPNHSALTSQAKLKAVCKAAIKMHTSGVYDRAVELYELALTIPISSNLTAVPTAEDGETKSLPFKIQLNLGSALLNLKRVEDSIEALKKAVRMEPEHVWAHYELGMAYKTAGRLDAAIAELKAVAKILPEAQVALVDLEQHKNRPKHVTKAISLPPPATGTPLPPTTASTSTPPLAAGTLAAAVATPTSPQPVAERKLSPVPATRAASPATATSKGKLAASGIPPRQVSTPANPSNTIKQRLKDLVRHVAHTGNQLQIHWRQLFGLVDRYRLGVVTAKAFKEILCVAGFSLTPTEYADLIMYLRDPNDAGYILYSKLLEDPIFVASSYYPAEKTLDQHCFHGERKRTHMEKLHVPLHMIAQSECLDYFSTLAAWATFGVSKSVNGSHVLDHSWLNHLMQVPACAPTIVTNQACIFARNALADGVVDASRKVVIRRQVVRKLTTSLLAQAKFKACEHMSRWRKDSVYNVSVAMGHHVLDCAVAKIMLCRWTKIGEDHVAKLQGNKLALYQVAETANQALERCRLADMSLTELAHKALGQCTAKRKALKLLEKLVAQARRLVSRQQNACMSLGDVVEQANRKVSNSVDAMSYLQRHATRGVLHLEQARAAALERSVATIRLVVAQQVVMTILFTMVHQVGANLRQKLIEVDEFLPSFDDEPSSSFTAEDSPS